MRDFEERFMWLTIEDDVCFQDDGSIMMIFRFDGWDYSLMAHHDMLGVQQQMQNLLHELPEGYYLEFHLLRQFDSDVSDRYRQQPLVRAKKIGSWFRNKIADQVALSEMANKVAVTVTRVDPAPPSNPGKRLKRMRQRAQELRELAVRLMRNVPNAKLDTLTLLSSIITHCYARNRHAVVEEGGLRHHLISLGRPRKNSSQNGMLQLPDGRYYCGLVLQYYPDCDMGWVCAVASEFGEAHITQCITPAGNMEIIKSKKAEDLAQALSSREGSEQAEVIAGDQRSLREHIAQHQLKLFRNTWSLALFDSDPAQLQQRMAAVEDRLHQQGALVRRYDEMQLACWFYQLPGQGHLSRRWRADETWQVIAMTPNMCHYSGRLGEPFMLRLGTGYQGVALGYQNGEVAHHCTIAATGAGKSLDRCARILECFSLGIDIYLLEIGRSGWWAIEAVGGTYHALDPDRDAINPMPPLSCLTKNGSLPQDIISVTVETLAFLLKPTTNSVCTLDTFERTTVQLALIACYRPLPKSTPSLLHLRDQLLLVSHPELPQVKQCAKTLSDHLSAFLMSIEGKQFMANQELTLEPGACGIDLSQVRNKAPSLLKLYLVFVALKFGQMACGSKQRAEIILDETHEFVRLAPEVMRPLIEGLARMGRKEASYIDLITQELEEIDAIGRAVINQMFRKTLLYRSSDHDSLAERVGMGDHIKQVWKGWQNPFGFSWRPGLEYDGKQWVELLLTFPDEVLAITRTDPMSTPIKEAISKQTNDPIERIQMFMQETHNEQEATASSGGSNE